ncbi:MAG: hypothetical protein JXA71_08130, partial [Chitinispirillaceae bacterium]|nr:hypothetical protein [Chitinispirillaceae bacterium]
MASRPGKRFSRVVVVAAVLGASVLTAIVAAIVAISLPPVQRRALSAVERAVSGVLSARVTIGSLHTNIVDRIVLRNVALVGDSGYGDSLTVERVRIRYDLSTLLQRAVNLRRIRLDGARVRCVRSAGGV